MSMWKRLFASYLIFVLIIGVVIFINFYEFNTLNKQVNGMGQQHLLNDTIEEISHDTLAQGNAAQEYLLGRSQASLDKYHTYHLKVEGDIVRLQDFIQLFPNLATEIGAAVRGAKEENETFEKAIEAITSGKPEESQRLSLAGSTHHDNVFQPVLNDLEERSHAITHGLLNEALSKLKDLIAALFSLFAFATLLGLALGYVLSKHYTNPIKKLTEATVKDQNGNYKTIEGTFSNDEVGLLATAFNNMVLTINQERQSLEEQNLKLRSQQEELSAQNEEITAQQEELTATLDMVNAERAKSTELNEFNGVLNKSIELKDLAINILHYCLEAFDAVAGAVLLKDKDSDAINITASSGYNAKSDDQIHLGSLKGLAKRCLLENQSINVSYPETNYHAGVRLDESRKLIHEVYIPIIFNSQTLGLLILGRLSGDKFKEEDVSFLNTLMKQGAIAINNALNYHQIEKMYDDLLEQASLVEELNAQLETERDNIKQAQEITRSVVESINEAIVMVDIEDRVVAVNKRWGQLFQYDGELRGYPSAHLFSSSFDRLKNSDEAYDKLREIISEPMKRSEFNLIQENRVLRVWTGPVLDRSDNVIGRLFVFRDITKEAEIDRMKSEFVSTVSHELRTPLSSILGFSELLLIKKVNEEVRSKYIKTIHKEAQRLTNLVNDFLDLQRMESGKQVYNKEDIAVHDLFSDVINSFSSSGYHHDIKVELASNLIVEADKERIIQVLINLLSNAAKFSPDAGEIIIGAAPDEEYVRFFVNDKGLGIPKDVQANLFSKFYRVDNSDRRKIGGTGLGLAICKEIIEAHEGKIWVESEHGKGSTFHFTVKLSDKNLGDDDKSIEQGVVSCSLPHDSAKKVLLVEDDRSLAMLFKDQLESSGYRVEVRATGEEALESIKLCKPDVIILDILLAGKMNGWSVLQILKNNQSAQKIPIIVSSCLSEKEVGLAMGASEYLVKPFEPQMLIHIVDKLVSEGKENQPVMIMPKNPKISDWLLKRLKEKGFSVKDIMNEKEAIFVVVEKN